MEDICIFCTQNLATVTFTACGHRQYCSSCYRGVTRNGILKNCPICDGPVTATRDTTAVQLQETTLAEFTKVYDDLKQDYPYGCILFQGNACEESFANRDVVEVVREAMQAVRASRLDFQQLTSALKERLTVAQYQIVFVELFKEVNLHGILEKLDFRKFERRSVTTSVKKMIIRSIEDADNKAIASRAVLGTFGSAAVDLATSGINGFASASAAGCGISNAFMFTIFSAVELYRWSKGDLDGREAAKNIGEHAVGSICGFGGGYGGFVGGACLGGLIGSAIPGLGTAIGGVIGGIIGTLFGGLICDTTGRWLYRKFLPRNETSNVDREENQQKQMTPEEVANKAAEKFDINLKLFSFVEAHARFRRRLLDSHPDKHPNASAEERERLTAETRDILACWLILREYYNDKKEVEDAKCEEGFIKAFVLKVFDSVANQWRVVRTFFDIVKLDHDINEATEKIEAVTFYL